MSINSSRIFLNADYPKTISSRDTNISDVLNNDYRLVEDKTEPFHSNKTVSKTVGSFINQLGLEGTKLVDKNFADIGDTLTYTLKFKNTGTVDFTSTVITDQIPPGTTFIPRSITSSVDYTGISPVMGLTLTNPIIPDELIIISFQVLIADEIPQSNPLLNQAIATYHSTLDPDGPILTSQTNPVTTQINHATLEGIKTVNKNFADIGDTLLYTLTFTNIGNMPANNVIIADSIPAGTTFVPGSIASTVPFSGTNLETGLTLTNPVTVGDGLTITFQVLVTSKAIL